MRRIKILRCKNCNHTFIPEKRKRKYQCRSCGRKGTVGRVKEDNFQIYTSKDIQIILDYFEEGKPKKLLSLDDIDPRYLYTWCSNKMGNREPEETLHWLKRKGYDHEKAWAITEKLLRTFGYSLDGKGRVKMPKYEEQPKSPEPGPEEEEGTSPPPVKRERKKLKLKSGDIEHFHRRYRQFKELHPDREPQAHHVREWFRGSHKDSVLYRWAVELLEKHKPKEYREGLLPDEESQ